MRFAEEGEFISDGQRKVLWLLLKCHRKSESRRLCASKGRFLKRRCLSSCGIREGGKFLPGTFFNRTPPVGRRHAGTIASLSPYHSGVLSVLPALVRQDANLFVFYCTSVNCTAPSCFLLPPGDWRQHGQKSKVYVNYFLRRWELNSSIVRRIVS